MVQNLEFPFTNEQVERIKAYMRNQKAGYVGRGEIYDARTLAAHAAMHFGGQMGFDSDDRNLRKIADEVYAE